MSNYGNAIQIWSSVIASSFKYLESTLHCRYSIWQKLLRRSAQVVLVVWPQNNIAACNKVINPRLIASWQYCAPPMTEDNNGRVLRRRIGRQEQPTARSAVSDLDLSHRMRRLFTTARANEWLFRLLWQRRSRLLGHLCEYTLAHQNGFYNSHCHHPLQIHSSTSQDVKQ